MLCFGGPAMAVFVMLTPPPGLLSLHPGTRNGLHGCSLGSQSLVSLLVQEDISSYIQAPLAKVFGSLGGSFLGCEIAPLGCFVSSDFCNSCGISVGLAPFVDFCSMGCALRSGTH